MVLGLSEQISGNGAETCASHQTRLKWIMAVVVALGRFAQLCVLKNGIKLDSRETGSDRFLPPLFLLSLSEADQQCDQFVYLSFRLVHRETLSF